MIEEVKNLTRTVKTVIKQTSELTQMWPKVKFRQRKEKTLHNRDLSSIIVRSLTVQNVHDQRSSQDIQISVFTLIGMESIGTYPPPQISRVRSLQGIQQVQLSSVLLFLHRVDDPPDHQLVPSQAIETPLKMTVESIEGAGLLKELFASLDADCEAQIEEAVAVVLLLSDAVEVKMLSQLL